MLVTMGNNNGPRETINEFPCGSAPNEIEIHPIVYVPILNTIIFIIVGIPYLIDYYKSNF